MKQLLNVQKPVEKPKYKYLPPRLKIISSKALLFYQLIYFVQTGDEVEVLHEKKMGILCILAKCLHKYCISSQSIGYLLTDIVILCGQR